MLPDGRPPILVVEVEAQERLVLVSDALQQPPLGSRQIERVAVDVDALRVATRVDLRTVRIEHRDHQQRYRIEDLRHFHRVGPRKKGLGDVEKRRRGRRLVAMHLRPEHDLHRAPAERHHRNRPVVERPADLLDLKGVRIAMLQGADALQQLAPGLMHGALVMTKRSSGQRCHNSFRREAEDLRSDRRRRGG